MSRLTERTNAALARFGSSEIPRHLAYVHDRVTVPSEGGATRRGFDNTGFTFRGITVDTFMGVMREQGVEYSSWEQAMGELRRIARTRSLHDEFADLVSYVHYRNYFLRPGFQQLPESFQAAVYDPSFHRGPGSALMMTARMLEREGMGDFPGIYSIGAPQNVDIDPVIIERIIDEHFGDNMRNYRQGRHGAYQLVPTRLRERFERYGLHPGTDFQLSHGGVPIDFGSETPITVASAKHVGIQMPYSERALQLPQGDAERAPSDELVRQVAAAANAYVERERSAGRTDAEIASSVVTGIERERVEHYRQIVLVEPSNDYPGWAIRSDRAAREIAAYSGGVSTFATQVEIPREQREALRHIGNLRSAVDGFNNPLNLISSPGIDQHLEVIAQVFADRDVTIGDTAPGGRAWRRATRTTIDLEDILPGIDYGATDAADDNTVLATNAFGTTIPSGGPLSQALITALREYYSDPANMDALNETNIESLGRIRFDVYQGRGGTYVDINEISPTIAGRLHRPVTTRVAE